ncbi:hypothetical protein [Haloferax sp. ATB1]|uniref:hypothetical protein n=1 Tax=Haloferax sp. ATB1 TaxID=1508454 RepID=UPI000A4E5EFF|nr:hypothetical protein [Haloferax sp. ATB1]
MLIDVWSTTLPPKLVLHPHHPSRVSPRVDAQLIRDEFVCPYHGVLDEDGADQ